MPDWEAFHTTEKQGREWFDRLQRVEYSPILDRPTEPHPILVLKLDQLLTEMLWLSDGAIGSYTPSPEVIRSPVDRTNPLQRALADVPEYNHSGHIASSNMPESTLSADLAALKGQFDKVRTNRERLLVIKAVQNMVITARFAPRSKQAKTPEWKQAIATDPRSCGLIAQIFGTSPSTVKRIKREAGTIGKQGRPKRATTCVAA